MPRKVLRDEFEKKQGRVVGPVEVVEDEQDRTVAGSAIQEGANRIEEPKAISCRICAGLQAQIGKLVLELG